MIQLALLQDDTIKKSIINVPIHDLTLSRFNPRTTRPDEDIDKLAQRISRNGFEITRALWAIKNGNGYEVFAGGTRLEAAKRAGCKTLPVVLHEGLTDEDVVRLAYEDNDNDEYHAPVSIVDVWANYAALQAQGWKQEKIADAVGLKSHTWVSRRLQFNDLSEKIKNFVRQGLIDEAKLAEITALCVDAHFSIWLTTETAWVELAQEARKLTTKETRVLVTKWKEFIQLATDLHAKLDPQWQQDFIRRLAESNARNKAAVQSAYNATIKAQLAEAQRIEDELASQQSKAEAERIRIEQERRKQEAVEKTINLLQFGDGIAKLETFPDDSIDLIFTDPPYDDNSIELYGQLAEVASRKLKTGGSLIAYAGHYALPRIFELMCPHLRYWWLLSIDHGGASARLPGKWVFVEYKPLVWFVKDKRFNQEYVTDKFKSKTPDKQYHEWAQDISEAQYYIEHLTNDSGLVVDPFAGSGTTLIAALQIGRKCIGYELDKERFNNGRERLYQFASETR